MTTHEAEARLMEAEPHRNSALHANLSVIIHLNKKLNERHGLTDYLVSKASHDATADTRDRWVANVALKFMTHPH